MMVIDPQGRLIHDGAINGRPSTRETSLEGAHHYVAAALDESMAGGEVTIALTRPYG